MIYLSIKEVFVDVVDERCDAAVVVIIVVITILLLMSKTKIASSSEPVNRFKGPTVIQNSDITSMVLSIINK